MAVIAFRCLRWALLAILFAVAPAVRSEPNAIAWRHASTGAEVDAAFAAARAERKPVFFYWGATWCPPCNQVKATLFNRQDFIERTRAFVAVYVDGDRPGAQRVGARFKVSGYPTMVLFDADGRELTRLPGEVEPARYQEVLTLGLSAKRPVQAVLADALAGGATLTPGDWRLLSYHSWETDGDLVPPARLATTLARLAAAVPASERSTATRLALKSLALHDADGAKAGVAAVEPQRRATLQTLLADPRAAREQADVLANSAAEIVRAASAAKTPERAALVTAYDAALARFAADPTLSRADRVQATTGRVELARIDQPDAERGKPETPPTLGSALVAQVRELAARMDRETTDGYERQAVVTALAHLLQRAGLGPESDALLEANLTRSHSPYYLMSGLASNARKRGDARRALDWYGRAFETSIGPATRLQWGASYLNARVDLAPADEAAIEALVARLWQEAAAQPDAFSQRSGRSLQRVGAKLHAWNAGGAHAGAMQRLARRLDAVCSAGSLDADDRRACRALLDAKPAGAAVSS